MNDGSSAYAVSSAVSRSIFQTGVNDAPVLSSAQTTVTFTEGGGSISAFALVTVADADSASLASGSAQLSVNFVSATDQLSTTVTVAGIVNSFSSTTGTLSLTGMATAASYQGASALTHGVLRVVSMWC